MYIVVGCSVFGINLTTTKNEKVNIIVVAINCFFCKYMSRDTKAGSIEEFVRAS